jgi:hypothetical protein
MLLFGRRASLLPAAGPSSSAATAAALPSRPPPPLALLPWRATCRHLAAAAPRLTPYASLAARAPTARHSSTAAAAGRREPGAAGGAEAAASAAAGGEDDDGAVDAADADGGATPSSADLVKFLRGKLPQFCCGCGVRLQQQAEDLPG